MTPLERSRGLGTRLATLLPIEGSTPEPSEGPGRGVHAVIPVTDSGGDVDRVIEPDRFTLRHDQAVFLGLEILQSALPIEVAAYVHQRRDKVPQVHIRATGGAAIEADGAFSLSDQLADVLMSGRRSPSSTELDGYTCLFVATAGEGSRGMHLLGRRGPSMCARDVRLAERFCVLLGQSLHRQG